VVAGWTVGLALTATGIVRLEVETDVIRWFSRDHPIRVDYEVIRRKLSGISPMNIVIESEDGGAVTSPEVISALDNLTSYLESLPEVGKALSIADPLRQLHGGFSGDPTDPVPVQADLIEQYLLLLESKEYIRDLVTADRAMANVLLRVDDNRSGALLAVAARGERWWESEGPAGFSARTTGIMYEFARAEDEIARGQILGLLFALSAVAMILLAIFRWPRLAGAALLPNALPVAMTFGVMGLLGVAIDAGTVLVGNLALGIAVDDTIHVVNGFYQSRERGTSSRQALESVLARVLPALVFTTLAVALGFAVLSFSELAFIRHLGRLTAGIMVLCLLADVILLPALLLGFPNASSRSSARTGKAKAAIRPA
jgi:predicted RND superfamily exporter protein